MDACAPRRVTEMAAAAEAKRAAAHGVVAFEQRHGKGAVEAVAGADGVNGLPRLKGLTQAALPPATAT
jgi:hypothetical protein